jgi:hypothetical protein
MVVEVISILSLCCIGFTGCFSDQRVRHIVDYLRRILPNYILANANRDHGWQKRHVAHVYSALLRCCRFLRCFSKPGETFAKRLGATWSTVSTRYCETWGHGQHRRLRFPLQSLLLINCNRRSMIRLYQRRVGRTLRAYFIKLSIRLRLFRTVIGPWESSCNALREGKERMHRSTELVGNNRIDPEALADSYISATRHGESVQVVQSSDPMNS